VFTVVAIPFVIFAAALACIYCLQFVRPSPLEVGSVIPRLCPVSMDDIEEYCLDNESSAPSSPEVRRETRRNQFRVARRYIRQMTWNTRLFEQLTRFEKLKIDPRKSPLDYQDRERLTVKLVEEAAILRWMLIKEQTVLLLRPRSYTAVQFAATQKLKDLAQEYKTFEQDIVALVSMAKNNCYHYMLRERLGLIGWEVVEGGSSAS
jgi:hypothetical protein